jgi:hypothetical protein
MSVDAIVLVGAFLATLWPREILALAAAGWLALRSF